jgi:hypothetical protein
MSFTPFDKENINNTLFNLHRFLATHERIIDNIIVPIAKGIQEKASVTVNAISNGPNHPGIDGITNGAHALITKHEADAMLARFTEQTEDLEQITTKIAVQMEPDAVGEADILTLLDLATSTVRKCRNYIRELVDCYKMGPARETMKLVVKKYLILEQCLDERLLDQDYFQCVLAWCHVNPVARDSLETQSLLDFSVTLMGEVSGV